MAEPTGDTGLTAFLSTLSHQELIALMLEMARRFPELRDALAVRQMLASDDADRLEAEMLGRIVAAGAAPGWSDRWDDEAHLADYSPVYDGLKLLLDQGHADVVVRLGEELLETGICQFVHIFTPATIERSSFLKNWDFKGDFWAPNLFSMHEMPDIFKIGEMMMASLD